MVRFCTLAAGVILAVSMVAAAFVGFGLARSAPASQAQFELQVEEGLGPFDRLPSSWAALHRL